MQTADALNSAQQPPAGSDGTRRRARQPGLQTAAHGAGILSELMLPEDYRNDGRQHIYKSPQSILWVIRDKRDGLVKAGALYLVNGKIWVHPRRFDAFLVKEGRQAMLAKAAA